MTSYPYDDGIACRFCGAIAGHQTGCLAARHVVADVYEVRCVLAAGPSPFVVNWLKAFTDTHPYSRALVPFGEVVR